MRYDISVGDVVEWANQYEGEQFHAMFCDPPYELGFMGKSWDASGIAFNPKTWAALSAHLLPGGFGMAFASSRGWHRMAVAIEDAGLIIHPSIFGWSYASGFPKATRIDSQIDKAEGLYDEREVVGVAKDWATPRNGTFNASFGDNTITKPVHPLAQAWEGHRYGRQALKPALEPLIVFQKPYAGKPVDSITQTGAGALNIDGGRIGTEERYNPPTQSPNTYGGFDMCNGTGDNVTGRWPANLTLTHHPACNGVCVEGCPVRRIGTDEARFFFNADWSLEIEEQLANADPVCYQPKASRSERDGGLEGFELKIKSTRNSYGDQSQYIQSDGARRTGNKGDSLAHNPHPTVKPIALAQHFATLLLPPDLYAPRRILIPFSGSGSEIIGALLAGWDYVQGVELSQEYANIALARLAHWVRWADTETKPVGVEPVKPKTVQLGLF